MQNPVINFLRLGFPDPEWYRAMKSDADCLPSSIDKSYAGKLLENFSSRVEPSIIALRIVLRKTVANVNENNQIEANSLVRFLEN